MRICPRCLTEHPDERALCPDDGEPLVAAELLHAGDVDLAPGTLAGEYVIEEKIGQGGFGAVYRAAHPVIGKAAAVKVLHSRYSSNPQIVARFITEARAVNQVRHPNIVDIFAFGQVADGRRYYVMELLEGVPLDRYLASSGPVPPAVALPLLRGIAHALDAAHAAGIAHRDLKPENIFLCLLAQSLVSAKLLDFGIAKLFGERRPSSLKTQTGAPLGTPHYMSPEQCRGKPVDQRTDVYSFGVVLHRMLTGRLPFDSDDPVELLNAQANQPPPRMSSVVKGLPEAADAPVLRMLEKDPERRPASVTSALEAVVAVFRGDGTAIGDGTTVEGAPFLDSVAAVSRQKTPSGPRGSVPVPAGGESRTPPALSGRGGRSMGLAAGALPARVPWLAAAGVAALLALVGVGLAMRGSGPPAGGSVSPSSPAAPSVPSGAPSPAEVVTATPPAAASASASSSATTTSATEVVVALPSVPDGTTVSAGDAVLGTAPGSVRLPRGTKVVTLRIAAPGYPAVTIDVLPDQDRTLAVTLPPKLAAPPRPRPKDLEPF